MNQVMLQKFLAFQLAKKCYHQLKDLRIMRMHHEQLVRAASSIALNLAEGSGRRTEADRRRFFSMAYGSYRECCGILELEDVKEEALLKNLDQLGAMLYRLSHGDQFKIER